MRELTGWIAAAVLGAATAAAQEQPAGDPARSTRADQPGAVNDPARNQAGNPADAGDPDATSGRVPVSEPYLPLTIGHFNHLDEDKDGVLSQRELADDATLESRFEEIDADGNRAIDDVEFLGYQPTRPAEDAAAEEDARPE
ncbi:hypothetical protein BH24PSE2_BH24PSE2_07590 [soil metagenome]